VTILFELTINYYKDRILYKQIEKVLRKILGIEDTTTRFYPSMVNLIYHKDFNIVKRIIKNRLVKTNKSKHSNLGLISEEIIEMVPQRENIHYVFFRGSGEDEPPQVTMIKCEGENLTEIFDPNSDKEIVKNCDDSDVCFTVRKKLEKGKKYVFTVITKYPLCMSDLTIPIPEDKLNDFNKKYQNMDEFEYSFLMPTHNCEIKIEFPFSLKKYKLHITRENPSISEVISLDRHPDTKIDKKNNKIRINQSNLVGREIIRVMYSKK